MDFLFRFGAAANDACFHNFFGLIPWYQYLKDKIGPAPQCNITNFNVLPGANDRATDIPLVLAAVVDDLLRIAGMVALVFVLIGAINYITSQGNPEDAGKAQEAITNALIGLVIALFGVAFISFIGNRLGS